MILIDIYVAAVALVTVALFVVVTRDIRNEAAIASTPAPLAAKAA